MSTLIEAIDLEIAYGDVAACQDISFKVEENEIVTLIGSNGAGKSTTMRAVAGAMYPRKGKIIFDGIDITKMPSFERNQLGIALVPEGRHVFPFLTVIENLEMGGYCHRNNRPKMNSLIEKMVTMFPKLKMRAKQPAGTLSGGEQQRVAVARALINDPAIVLADEPSGNLDSNTANNLHQLFFKLREELNQTFIIVTHNEELAEMADRKIVMRDGKVVL